MTEDIILSVQDNALGVTEGIEEMQRIDASVGRGGRCYHWLRSYELMVLNAHEGCKDGVEWVEQEDAITGFGAMRTQCSIGRWGCYWLMKWKGYD